MTAIVQLKENRYYERMRSAAPDKVRMLDFLVDGSVIDVGCGGGDLLQACVERGFYGIGTDPLPSDKISPSVFVHPLYADETHIAAGLGHVDNIMLSSVMHEVFSYGNRYGKQGREHSLELALCSMRKALRPGGRLVMRDFVAPSDPVGGVHSLPYLKFENLEEGDDLMAQFVSYSPFMDASRQVDRTIRLRRKAEGVWEGQTAGDLMEAAFTVNWYKDDAPGSSVFLREVQEFYGVFDLDGYTSFVEQFGFRVLHAEAYVQDDYRMHMDPWVTFVGCDFPPTKAMWVYEAV